MNHPCEFSSSEIERIVSRFGCGFYEKVSLDLKIFAAKWSLRSFHFIPSYSANLVFTCISETYGSSVLKIGNPRSREIITEYRTLHQYNGGRFCRVFEADLENGVFLEEHIQPGIPLRNEPSLEKRLSIFSSLYNGLYQAPMELELYPTYSGWVHRITEYMSTRSDAKALYLYMLKARELCLSVAAQYPQKMLLHGDFHHDNILLNRDGDYTIIDPKGVIGDPVFDVPRFILNEFSHEITGELYGSMQVILSFLESSLTLPRDILKQCLFIETTMGACWNVEDGSTPSEYEGLLRKVAFAESLL